MAEDKETEFEFDIPVVTSRREFFEQEAVMAEPAEQLDSDLEPEEVADRLSSMREAAAERTNAALDQQPDDAGE